MPHLILRCDQAHTPLIGLNFRHHWIQASFLTSYLDSNMDMEITPDYTDISKLLDRLLIYFNFIYVHNKCDCTRAEYAFIFLQNMIYLCFYPYILQIVSSILLAGRECKGVQKANKSPELSG